MCWSSDDILVGGGAADIFRYTAAIDSTVNAFDFLGDALFDGAGTEDILNLSDLGLGNANGQASILGKADGFTNSYTSNFFNDGGVDRYVATQYDGTDSTWIYVDANESGNFETSYDLTIKVDGDASISVNDIDFGADVEIPVEMPP